MDKNKWRTPTKESLKEAYGKRGQYPDQNNRRYIFNALGNEKTWKVTDKSHKVRLLPVHPDDNINFYGLTVHIHTNVGVNGDQFLCLKRMKNINCPICEHQVLLWDTEPEMAKDLYPQTRYLVWLVDLSQASDKQTAQIWSCPRTAMDDILGASYKKSTDEILNLANIDDGIAIYFDREKTPNTTFSKYKNFQLDDAPIVAKEIWLNNIVSFTEVIEYASYEEIKNTFFGLNEEIEPKKDVSPLGETPKNSETTQKEEVVNNKTDEMPITNSIDDMDRTQLEEFALIVLADDYEDSEIKEMGTKKLRRLAKEAPAKKVDKVEEETPEDPKEVLKRKLRERIQ